MPGRYEEDFSNFPIVITSLKYSSTFLSLQNDRTVVGADFSEGVCIFS